jgi:hypothetical protein
MEIGRYEDEEQEAQHSDVRSCACSLGSLPGVEQIHPGTPHCQDQATRRLRERSHEEHDEGKQEHLHRCAGHTMHRSGDASSDA